MNRYKAITIISVLFIFIMMIVTVTAVVQPQRERAAESNEQADKMEAQNQELQDYIDYLIVEEGRISMTRSQLEQAQRRVPAGYRQQDFIDEINNVATESGIQITNLTFTSASLAALPTVATSQLAIGRPVQIPFNISASGTYDQLRDFIHRMQTEMTRIAVPNTIQYNLAESNAQEGADVKTAQISAIMWSMLTDSDAVSGDSATEAS